MKPRPFGPKRLFAKPFALRGLRERPLDFILEMAERYGDLVYFRSWRNPVFFFNHPKMVREVLIAGVHDFVRADGIRSALRVFDGQSLLVSEGDQWRQQRRFLQQGFRSQHLRGYARKAVENTHEAIRKWPSSGEISAGDEMSRLCMNTLGDILFGTRLPPGLVESIRVVLDARAVETGRSISTGYLRTAAIDKERDLALGHVNGFLDELIQSRRADVEERGDVLGILLRASQADVKNGKTQRPVDRQIRDDMMSMINASTDALAAAMSWTLYLVAKHTTVQARLRQEIKSAVNGHAETAADNAELPYAESVIRESMRLYPPNWALIPRRCVRQSTIEGYRIPRGSWVYIFPYVLHRDARWFASPESFDPDRFNSEDFGSEQRSAYIPLGLGPHVCIGTALSAIVLTSILARILQEFQLELPASHTEIVPEVRVVIRPTNGLPLVANRLESAKRAMGKRIPRT